MKLQITQQLDSFGTRLVYYVKKDNSFLSVHYTLEEAEAAFEQVKIQTVVKPVIIKEIEL